MNLVKKFESSWNSFELAHGIGIGLWFNLSALSENLRSPFWRLKYLCIKLTLKTQFGLRYNFWNKRIFDARTSIATPYVCDKIFVAKSELFPVEISVRPQPDFGIGNRNQGLISVSVLEQELFFPKPQIFQKKSNKFKFLSCYPSSWDDIDFYKLEKKI